MYIIGAGLSGCLAGVLMPGARLFEAAADAAHLAEHRAVLRFRTDRIAQALGIPFQKVLVHKSVYDGTRHSQWVTPAQHNAYARKVVGALVPRSIINLDPAVRWVGPANLHAQLVELCVARIRFGHRLCRVSTESVQFENEVYLARADVPVISTIPLGHLLPRLHPEVPCPEPLRHAAIFTERYGVAGCGMHQTIYFPNPALSLYRATLTGPDLILESMHPLGDSERHYAFTAFGLKQSEPILRGEARMLQQWGKIVELPAGVRKTLLLNITLTANVYSLGRFACYRNSLLDDVYQDIFRIREMIKMGHYDLRKQVASS